MDKEDRERDEERSNRRMRSSAQSEQNQIIKCREGERKSNKMRWGGGGESESTSFSTHTLVT